jgi:hypothetical protein
MGRKGEIVNTTLFHINLPVSDHLRRINKQSCPILVSDAADLRHIVKYTEDIRSTANGHKPDTFLSVLTRLVITVQDRIELFQVHKTLTIN